jgi:epoxyqueuosine reductase
MNVARAMGNSLDERFVPDLAAALDREEDERVLAMCAWSLGRLGGKKARKILETARQRAEGIVREEIESALEGWA